MIPMIRRLCVEYLDEDQRPAVLDLEVLGTGRLRLLGTPVRGKTPTLDLSQDAARRLHSLLGQLLHEQELERGRHHSHATL